MSIQHQNLMNELRELNKARLGSFGEFIFESASLALGMQIESQRNQSIDFRLEGQPIDVKATLKNLDKPYGSQKIRIYKGRRYEGIKYAMVEFFCDATQLSIEGDFFCLKTWPEIHELWMRWKINRRISPTSEMRNAHKEIINNIQADLSEFFARNGLAMRTPVLYRTKRFDKSPDNLKPGPRKRHLDLTVYIDFHNDQISRDNILRITAFPHSRVDELPMAAPEAVHLHRPKVDLDIIDGKYLFKDIDDLKQNYRKMFK